MSIKSDEFWIRLCTGWVLAVDEMKKDWKKNWPHKIVKIVWYGYWLLLLYAGADVYPQASDAEDYKAMIAGMFAFLIAMQMIFLTSIYDLLSSKIKYSRDKA